MPRQGLSADRVVAAAAAMADDVGLARVTLSALARDLGVRQASLYAHVRGLDDLRARVALLALDDLAERLAAALAGRAGLDALTAFADTHRALAREHPGRWEALRHPLDADTARASAGPRVAELAGAVLRGYHLDGDDLIHGTRLLGSLVHGFVQLESGGGFAHSTPPADASWTRSLQALDALLRAWPDPAQEATP